MCSKDAYAAEVKDALLILGFDMDITTRSTKFSINFINGPAIVWISANIDAAAAAWLGSVCTFRLRHHERLTAVRSSTLIAATERFSWAITRTRGLTLMVGNSPLSQSFATSYSIPFSCFGYSWQLATQCSSNVHSSFLKVGSTSISSVQDLDCKHSPLIFLANLPFQITFPIVGIACS